MHRKGATALQNDKTGKKTADSQQSGGACESCEFYDYDGDEDAYVCCVALDQDAMADFLAGQNGKNRTFFPDCLLQKRAKRAIIQGRKRNRKEQPYGRICTV